MKRYSAAIVVAAGILCGLAFSKNPTVQDPTTQRIDKLEQELAAARLRVGALSTELAESTKRLEAIEHYLDQYAKSAADLYVTLDESEKAGFTFGINPESRHILLRGWRQQLADAQKEVPVPPPPAPEPAPTKGAKQ